MKLNQFIQQTIWEISSGVSAGAIRARPFAAIAPSMIDDHKVGEQGYIEFDISLIVSENHLTTNALGASVGGEISVAPFAKVRLGGKGDQKTDEFLKNEQTHRVHFKVPIYLSANFRSATELGARERDFVEKAIADDKLI